ncbi:KRBBA protein, partial [Pitta sordida]|nr:KRBBA protein [Pitta sordida]
QEDCRNQGGALVMPQDQDELDSLMETLRRPTSYFWIGLWMDRKGWTWLNSSSLDQSRFQQNPKEGHGDCGTIKGNRIYSENCNSEQQRICQREAIEL